MKMRNLQISIFAFLFFVLNLIQCSHQHLKPISLKEFDQIIQEDKNIIILDTRAASVVFKGFIPNSLTISLKTNFSKWVHSMFPQDQKFILITKNKKEHKSKEILGKLGFKNIVGYLKGGFETWKQSGREYSQIENQDIAANLDKVKNCADHIIDVREKKDWMATGVIPNSNLNSLSQLRGSIPDLKKKFTDNKNLYLVCGAGKTALIAGSVLKKYGVNNKMINLNGGIMKLIAAGSKGMLEKYPKKL